VNIKKKVKQATKVFEKGVWKEGQDLFYHTTELSNLGNNEKTGKGRLTAQTDLPFFQPS